MLSIKFLCCAALLAVSNALPGCAPAQACDNLMPGNPPHGKVEQATPNPWMIDLSDFDFNPIINMYTYNPGGTYNITLQRDAGTLRGFFIQGRTVFGNNMIGIFADPAGNDPNTRLSSCVTPEIGVTHNNGARMDLSGPFTFQWTAPAEGTGPIWFRYTVVQTALVWWADDATVAIQEAGNIQDLPTNSPTSTDAATQMQASITSNQVCIAVTSIAAVLCSLLFFFVGALSGGLGVFWITIHQQRRAKRDHQLPLDPLYEDLSEPATPKMRTSESHVEMETNEAYGHSESNVKMKTNAAYGHVESNITMGTNAAYGNVVTSESNIEMGTNAAYGHALTS